jgi:guanylate kinase
MNYEKLYNLVKPTSTTTRLPRIGEVCGEDYYYVYEEDIVNADGTFADHVINPIKFGQIKGRNI